MWSSEAILNRCRILQELGLFSDFGVGSRLGRGFADLGVEEFIVLPNDRILSLFTGSIAPLSEENRQHLFWVPSVEQCIHRIEELNYDLTNLSYVDRRVWQLSLNAVNSSKKINVENFTVEEVLLDGLIAVLKSKA